MIVVWLALHILAAMIAALQSWTWLAGWFLLAFGGELVALAHAYRKGGSHDE